jgi:hypothetical protein
MNGCRCPFPYPVASSTARTTSSQVVNRRPFNASDFSTFHHGSIRLRYAAYFAESCIRKAVPERGFTPGLIGLADAKAEDEAASRWADCRFAYGD